MGLRDYATGKKKSMLFQIPMIWRIPKSHHNDCYFCMVYVKGYSKKTKNKITYPNLESAILPVKMSSTERIYNCKVVDEIIDISVNDSCDINYTGQH